MFVISYFLHISPSLRHRHELLLSRRRAPARPWLTFGKFLFQRGRTHSGFRRWSGACFASLLVADVSAVPSLTPHVIRRESPLVRSTLVGECWGQINTLTENGEGFVQLDCRTCVGRATQDPVNLPPRAADGTPHVRNL